MGPFIVHCFFLNYFQCRSGSFSFWFYFTTLSPMFVVFFRFFTMLLLWTEFRWLLLSPVAFVFQIVDDSLTNKSREKSLNHEPESRRTRTYCIIPRTLVRRIYQYIPGVPSNSQVMIDFLNETKYELMILLEVKHRKWLTQPLCCLTWEREKCWLCWLMEI